MSKSKKTKVKLTWVEVNVIQELIDDYISEYGHWGKKEIPELKVMKKIKKKLGV
jgi:hypothetical protein